MEISVNGAAMTVESAALMAQVPALGAKINQSVGDFNAGVLTGAKQMDTNAQFQAAVNKDLMANTGIAIAGMAGVGGVVGTLNTQMGAQLQENNKYTAEAVAQAKKDLEEQKKTQDKTTGSMNDLIKANQEAMIKLQNAILESGAIPAFTKTVTAATNALVRLVNTFSGQKGVSAAGGESGGLTAGLNLETLMTAATVASLFGGRGGPKPPAPPGVPGVQKGPTPPASPGTPDATGGPKPGGAGAPKPGLMGRIGGRFGALASMIGLGAAGAGSAVGAAGASVAADVAGAVEAVPVSPKVATPTVPPAAGAGATAAAGSSAGTAAKAAGKSLMKFIPGVGLVMGVAGGAQRAMAGDYSGAALELGSGVASLMPGVGTAAAVGMQGTLLAKDLGAFNGKKPEEGSASGTPSQPRETTVPVPVPADRTSSTTSMSEQERYDIIKAKADAESDKFVEATKSMQQAVTQNSMNNTIEQLADIMTKLNENLESLININRDVASNTERTAQLLA
jgi:hypothetical protein